MDPRCEDRIQDHYFNEATCDRGGYYHERKIDYLRNNCHCKPWTDSMAIAEIRFIAEVKTPKTALLIFGRAIGSDQVTAMNAPPRYALMLTCSVRPRAHLAERQSDHYGQSGTVVLETVNQGWAVFCWPGFPRSNIASAPTAWCCRGKETVQIGGKPALSK